MLAFTRKPPPEDDVSRPAELLLDDADDTLVPLQPSPATEPMELVGDVAPSDDVTPRRSGEVALALDELRRFAESVDPSLGWRRVLFVVSGIRLRPSSTEHALRNQVSALLAVVDPPQTDPHKEASS